MEDRGHEFVPFDTLLREATASVEQELNIEDADWQRLGAATADIIPPNERQANLRASRRYCTLDPLGKQAIRLWTDYTFGSGMTFSAPQDAKKTQEVLTDYWDARVNQPVLSARGQRKSSDKLLIDGEVFMVVFEGLSTDVPVVRWIDPLEITEIMTDPEDVETPLYYRRQWTDRLGQSHDHYYPSSVNTKNIPTVNATGQRVSATEDGIVFHLTYNTITQRGNPLLLPALDWVKQYRRFLASRVAIMLALSRFAWSLKVKGGQTAVDAAKDKLTVDDDPPEAAAVAAFNEGIDLAPIKTDTGARNAYQDGRMLKLQISAAVGIPEQYFGDISIGNLATAKTVELPMMKMFQSLQKVWADHYQAIDELVLDHAKVPEDKWYVDRDFPPIAPKDVEEAAAAIEKIVATFPQFGDSKEVQQVALMTLGIDDTGEVLANLETEEKDNPDARFARAIHEFREKMVSGNGKGA